MSALRALSSCDVPAPATRVVGLQTKTLAWGTFCFMNCLNPLVPAVHAMCIAVSGTLKSSGRLVYQLQSSEFWAHEPVS